mmetsp:Transcript_1821/g.5083  ORF Transcript_1821/g.5083 Transcript_1821/m.5083 type:complete len:191 (-) Transcript_1821:287-859(-)
MAMDRGLPRRTPLFSIKEDRRTVGHPDSCASGFVPLNTKVAGCCEGCAFVLDALSPDLTVVECTPAFTALGGPMELQGSLEWIVSEKREFQCWVQASVNALLGDHVPNALHVHFAPRHLRSHWVVHADLSAVMGDVDANGVMLVQIVMSSHSLVQTKRKMRIQSCGKGTRRNTDMCSFDATVPKLVRLRL